jgi:PQQ-dependent catabolism-associated CXXCW motif protein
MAARGACCVLVAAMPFIDAAPAMAQNSFGGGAGGAGAPATAPSPPTARPPAPAAAPSTAPSKATPVGPGAGGSGLDAELARMESIERQDMRVAPPSQLHAGAMHGPTPTSLPGGRLVTTREIYELVRRTQGNRDTAPRVFDVLGAPERLPGALLAVPAAQPGTFDDATQREFGQFLQGVMQGRRDLPMIFYCASTQCWLSYNAALRAVRLGYTNVLWYRGGLDAWRHAKLPLERAEGAGSTPRR